MLFDREPCVVARACVETGVRMKKEDEDRGKEERRGGKKKRKGKGKRKK
jgi:hypothetical protein